MKIESLQKQYMYLLGLETFERKNFISLFCRWRAECNILTFLGREIKKIVLFRYYVLTIFN